MNGTHGLVIDVGVSDGKDSRYYIEKGFRVVGIEADPSMCEKLREMFAAEIKGGVYKLMPFAAGLNLGDELDFYSHLDHQGVSSFGKRSDINNDRYIHHRVITIDWRTIVAQVGVPRYLKIDIEGAELPFITSMVDTTSIPEFLSLECYDLAPCKLLPRLGYTRFKLVDQNPPGGFRLPAIQLEGSRIDDYSFSHSSGTFGLDLFGDGQWTSYEEFEKLWQDNRHLQSRTWFDCHAWKPS